jgi:type IV pilus assembly protein PilC
MTTYALKNKIYSWQGMSQQGQFSSGEISALSLNLAKIALAKRGLQITSLQKKPPSFLNKTKKITFIDIVLFFRQLSTLIIAGIPIARAIHILSQNTEQIKLTHILSSIKEDLAAGNGLAFSLQKFPRYFDKMTYSLIQAGEQSGTLDIMLERVAHHKENLSHLKNKIKQALFYPSIILIVAIAVTIIMLILVVPKFAELFQNMHSTLPFFTLLVIHIANSIRHSIMIIILSNILLGGVFYLTRRNPRVRISMDFILLKTPIIGSALQKFILAGFARSLATIFAAGIPITESLKILTTSTGNALYTDAIQKLYTDISIGKQLHFAMQTCKLFPSMMLQMIQIGEESGTLEKMLVKVAEFYESDLDHLIGNLSRLLEPLIMIILGVVIGGLVIAMYLPIFKLGAVI